MAASRPFIRGTIYLRVPRIESLLAVSILKCSGRNIKSVMSLEGQNNCLLTQKEVLLLDLVYDEIAVRDFLSEDDEILQILFKKLHKISS